MQTMHWTLLVAACITKTGRDWAEHIVSSLMCL